ncbi:MAG: FAD-binding protein, partial [Planctomycetaceae bacterium]|nr:FAD-binding protein [Planctomycetaceae bacterium]
MLDTTESLSTTANFAGPDERTKVVQQLKTLLGDRCSELPADLDQHAKDVSHHKPRRPDCVVFPLSNDEVAAVARLCHEHRVPIIPFGTGTAVEGGVVAIHGEVCVDLSRMNRILRFSPNDMDVTVQAGVTRLQLNKSLDESGTNLYFPIDPGADCTLGGMSATRASGSAAVRYGTMRDRVLALTVVLTHGEIIRIGSRARKSSAGYDLTHLFVGSEGTLGLIIEVTLRLARKSDAMSAAVCAFPDVDSALQAAIAILAAGIPMARLELLDEVQMAAVNRYSSLSYRESPTLFLEFHGSSTGVAEQTESARAIIGQFTSEEFQWATDEADRRRLWQARHDAYYASLALRPNGAGYVTDVCVPISNLAECIRRSKVTLKATRIPAPLFGHVGDGNFHVVFSIDPNSAEELAEVQRLSEEIITHALALDGTCTGEHGIGLGKRAALCREFGPAVEAMRAIKAALDP